MNPYPIILGGDHAAFEAEWATSGRPDNERPDWPLPSFDAKDWAQSFCKINPGIPEDVMLGWFANALMRGYDQKQADAHAEIERLRAGWDKATAEADGFIRQIERLTAALQGIAVMDVFTRDDDPEPPHEVMRRIARAALEGKP